MHTCGCLDLLVMSRDPQQVELMMNRSPGNPFKAVARPIFGYLSRHFNIKILAFFWTLLHLMVAVILTLNTNITVFIVAAFLNGFTMGGSLGARMVLVIELLGEQLLVSNIKSGSKIFPFEIDDFRDRIWYWKIYWWLHWVSWYRSCLSRLLTIWTIRHLYFALQ